jgi:hypothetical protein
LPTPRSVSVVLPGTTKLPTHVPAIRMTSPDAAESITDCRFVDDFRQLAFKVFAKAGATNKTSITEDARNFGADDLRTAVTPILYMTLLLALRRNILTLT